MPRLFCSGSSSTAKDVRKENERLKEENQGLRTENERLQIELDHLQNVLESTPKYSKCTNTVYQASCQALRCHTILVYYRYRILHFSAHSCQTVVVRLGTTPKKNRNRT
jgi:hypothetical protein